MASSAELIGISKLPEYLDALTFSQLGSLALGTSNLTGRKWDGAFVIFNEPEFAPNIPHISYGSHTHGGCTDIAWITDQKLAVATDAGSIEVWDLKAQPFSENALMLSEHSDVCSAVSVSNCGSQLVSAGWDGVIKVWDLAMDISIHTISLHCNRVLDVSVSGWCSDVFASASEDGTIKLYDNRDSQPASLLSCESVNFPCCLAWTSVSALFSGYSDGNICHFDIRSPGKALSSKQIHKKSVNKLVLCSAESGVVASCSNDLIVKAFLMSSWEEVFSSARHTDYVTGLAVDPVSKRLWSCGWDGKVLPHILPSQSVVKMET